MQREVTVGGLTWLCTVQQFLRSDHVSFPSASLRNQPFIDGTYDKAHMSSLVLPADRLRNLTLELSRAVSISRRESHYEFAGAAPNEAWPALD